MSVFWGPFQVYQLQLVSLSPVCSTRFFFNFCFLVRFKYLFIFLLSFIFTLWFVGTAKLASYPFLFLLITTRSILLAWIWWSVCISKSLRLLWVSCSWMDFTFVHIPFDSLVKFLSFEESPEDHLSHSVEPSLVIRCFHIAVPYNVIDHFISFSA